MPTAESALVLDVENRSGVARTTCGWRKAGLGRDAVRDYWRDVHSPAISRRRGVHWYRHTPFDAVRPDLFAPIAGVDPEPPADAQLMWMSDVVYADEEGVRTFMASPADPDVVALLLQDIEMIVDRSTTYRTERDQMATLRDDSGVVAPAGPNVRPTYSLFLRQRAEEGPFRETVRSLARALAGEDDVVRVRYCLFERPDMEAERAAGYPVKTHPVEQQYQAWVDLTLATLTTHAAPRDLPVDPSRFATQVSALHAYPVPATYTFVWDGRATLVGLRGFAGAVAIDALGADHARDPRLLEWMYGVAGHAEAPVSAVSAR